MRFKDVFSIIGPSMVGPSSSHTAGAVRIGRTARQLFGRQPAEVEIVLYKSFSSTYRGHGTDCALAAGLLNYGTDDARIRNAVQLAEEAGLSIAFHDGGDVAAHPNSVLIKLRDERQEDVIKASSIGGGNIEITGINEFDVKATMEFPTLVVFHEDRPGVLGEVTGLLGDFQVNIGYMEVDRKSRRGEALSVIELDDRIQDGMLYELRQLSAIRRVAVIHLTTGGSI
ncbi:L-serine ammonia-lyase, iron-sulfur-dependent subunit beta [Paenibacillus sp. PAMC21692]|uniref:L-serine ammonia-lyase, iron-sulfur-dependent subunit beta n=1 Tax=Paenibacillus sp. PAMC21692 TaxID=2762320 RepID=UPI00164CF840|nr:L-serine ammonia-lyase, iron-sulfur-dependent subunit beta [Paenibacillus sp. PAMC21692]QNK58734.1 L-serine ammonia-lyase, iron-sulfur-dependent, subunit beta [Paenibacillus sp. PAMC21692]